MLSKLISLFSGASTGEPVNEIKQIDEAMAYFKSFKDLAMADAIFANLVGEWFAIGGEKMLQQEREIALSAPTNQGKREAFSNAAIGVAMALVEQDKTWGKHDPISQATFLLGHVLRMSGLVYHDSPTIVAAAKEAVYRCEGLLVACAGLREQSDL